MAKLQIVHCRCCKGNIDRNTEKEGVDWIQTSKTWFYHKKCYEDWVYNKDNLHATKEDSEWMQYAYNYLTKDIKIPINYCKFKSQWENFTKSNMTSKGIYFSLRYFYDIQILL